MISTLQHPNLVKLYGFCMEDDQLLLIYEYMENNSLAHALFGNYFSQCSSFIVENLTYLLVLRLAYSIGDFRHTP